MARWLTVVAVVCLQLPVQRGLQPGKAVHEHEMSRLVRQDPDVPLGQGAHPEGEDGPRALVSPEAGGAAWLLLGPSLQSPVANARKLETARQPPWQRGPVTPPALSSRGQGVVPVTPLADTRAEAFTGAAVGI